MKLFEKWELGEDTRYIFWIVAIVLLVPPLFFALNRLFDSGPPPQQPPEKRIIVKEATSQPPAAPQPPPQAVANTVRDALKQGNYSTAYLSISRLPKDSPEYGEMSRMLAAEQKKHRPGLKRKPDPAAESVLHYYDESTPANRATDWLFVSFIEQAGAYWPRITIQLAGPKQRSLTGFRLVADGKSFDIPAPVMKSEPAGDKVAQWLDAPLDHTSFAAVQAAARARSATLLALNGQTVEQKRQLSDAEKKGLARIMEAYAAVGGNLDFLGAAPGNAAGKPLPKKK